MRIAIAMLLSTTWTSWCASSSQPSRPTIDALRAMTKRLAFPTWHEHRARRRELEDHYFNNSNYYDSIDDDSNDEDSNDGVEFEIDIISIYALNVYDSYLNLSCLVTNELREGDDVYSLSFGTSQDDEYMVNCRFEQEQITYTMPYASVVVTDQDPSTPTTTLNVEDTKDRIFYTNKNPWVHAKCRGSLFDNITISPTMVRKGAGDNSDIYLDVVDNDYALELKMTVLDDVWYDTAPAFQYLYNELYGSNSSNGDDYISRVDDIHNDGNLSISQDHYVFQLVMLPLYSQLTIQTTVFYPTHDGFVFSAVRYRNKVTNEVVSCTSCDDDLHCPPPPPLPPASSSPPPPASSSPSPTSSASAPPPPPESRPRTVVLIVVVAVVVVALLAASLVAALRYGSGSS